MKLTFKKDNNPKRFSSESESNLVQKSGVKIEVSESFFCSLTVARARNVVGINFFKNH